MLLAKNFNFVRNTQPKMRLLSFIEGDAGTQTYCITQAIPKNLSDIKSEQSFAPLKNNSIRLELCVHYYQTHVVYFHFHAALLVHVALNWL